MEEGATHRLTLSHNLTFPVLREGQGTLYDRSIVQSKLDAYLPSHTSPFPYCGIWALYCTINFVAGFTDCDRDFFSGA